jgi:hypothetical protein
MSCNLVVLNIIAHPAAERPLVASKHEVSCSQRAVQEELHVQNKIKKVSHVFEFLSFGIRLSCPGKQACLLPGSA